MSKFLDAVTSELTGQRAPKPFWFEPLSTRLTTALVDPQYLEEIKFEVKYTMTQYCDPSLPSEAKSELMRSFMSQLREAVYGDLREHVIELQRAMYEYDHKAMYDKVNDIMREICG